MSANDAPGEVDTNNLFGSPNISTASEDDEELIDPEAKKAAEEQRERETVDIDGVPIADKDIKFKAEDIKKKDKMNYFVNVEGAEERAKADAKKKEAEKRAADLKSKLKELFWSGKRKIFTLTLPVSVILIIIIASIVITSINNDKAEDQLIADALAEVQEMEEMPFRKAVLDIDNNEILDNALVNYNFDEVDGIYDKIIKTMTENIDIARVYMDKAYRIMAYHPDEVERIVHAAELAYSYAPDELEMANDLYSIYMFAKMPDKAAEIDYKLQQINLKSQAEAEESQDSEVPYYNEEDF